MAYGTIKVDTVTFTSEGIDTSVSISGLVRNPTFSGNITSTSTISGVTIQGGTLVSGATVTGSAGQFTTITGGTVNFTTITGTTAVITSGVFASGTAAAPSVSIGTTTNGIYSPGANQVAITTSGTGRLFVDSSGRVGVGTGSPSVKLEVSDATSSNPEIRVVDGTVNTQWYASNNGECIFGTFSNHPQVFRTNGSERLRITSTGALNFTGAGTPGITPAVTFNGSAPVNSLVIDSTGKVGIGTSSWTLNSVGTKMGVSLSGATGDGIALFSGQNVANQYVAIGSQYDNANSNNGSQIRFGIDNLGDTFSMLAFATAGGGTPSEKMRITSDGKVGIGTSTPQVPLQTSTARFTAYAAGGAAGTAFDNGVQINPGDGGSGNRPFIELKGASNTGLTNKSFRTYYDNGATESLYFTYQGGAYFGANVGIGTSNPIRKLSVSNDGAEGIEFGPGQTSNVNYEIHYNRSTAAYITKQTEAAQHIFNNATAEVARIDSSGRLLVGVSAVGTNVGTNRVVIRDTGNANGLSLIQAATPTGNQGPAISFGAWDNNQSDASPAYTARIHSRLKGGGVGAVNGDLGFAVVQSGTLAEVMSLNAAGYLKAANDGSPTNPTLNFHGFDQSTAGDATLYANAKNASYTGDVLAVYAERTNSSLYDLAEFASTHVPGVSGDTEFRLRGDGQAFADGSWSGGGADYAEYFEWLDKNIDAEDRRGISVILDGDKIREAVSGEDPIGVVSGNPSVVGDAAWNKWTGKYLRDDYGTYIQEDYEVEDEDGNTVIQQRRKLNPAYNPDEEYISREQRPEWDCVGLMGKLRIRKGQATGSRWIKMRDISDSVEEWLVR